MKAFITSIGESTTDLCEWALKRQGFDVQLVYNETSSLADKLAFIYAKADDDFVRVDADIVVNRNLVPNELRDMAHSHEWWLQFMTYDWHQQDITHGGVQFIKKEALPDLREHIEKVRHLERPETALSRIQPFYSPRRFETIPTVMGLNGYKANDIKRIKATKERRNQLSNYDFELAERLNAL